MDHTYQDFDLWTFEDIASSGRKISVNLQPCLYHGFSSIDFRIFRRLDLSELPPLEQGRFDVLSALAIAIKSWNCKPITKTGYAGALKRFVKWVDEQDCALSRSSIVYLLARYESKVKYDTNTVKMIATGLGLTEHERLQLFPQNTIAREIMDNWLFIYEDQRGVYQSDFLRLCFQCDSLIPIQKFATVRDKRLSQIAIDFSGRVELVRMLREQFSAHIVSKSHSVSSLSSLWEKLLSWFKWADETEQNLEKSTAVESLKNYSKHLVRRWQAGRIKATTAHQKILPVVNLLSSVLGLSSYQIKLNLALPRLLESGLTTKRLGQAELHEFCANLHILIRSLPSETLLTHITDPLTVKLLIKGKFHDHQLPEPYARLDTPECDSRIANLPLIQLRIWAEMNRFIAFTGCNLSIAQSLNLGNWREERENLIALKARANKLVSIRSSKLYAKHIDAHTNFLLKCLLVPVSDDCPLFPRIVTNCQGDSSLIAKAQAGLLEINVKPLDPNENKTNIRKWLYRTGITVYTSRTLRLAKATWLLRRYHGDQIRVAQGMGNKPSTVYRNYGGKGNLEQSILEWSEFWASSPLQAALTPGKCNAPGKYKPLDDQPVAPCTEGACLSCQNYRGEDNFDYVHRLLSYQYCLSFRAYGNPEIANLGGFIDEIINAYIKLHPEHKLKILFLKQVIAENPHPRFTALAQLGEALYGN